MALPGNLPGWKELPGSCSQAQGSFMAQGGHCARQGRMQTPVHTLQAFTMETFLQLWGSSTAVFNRDTLSTDWEHQQQGKTTRLDEYLLTSGLHLSVTFCSFCWFHIPPDPDLQHRHPGS